MEDFFCFLKNNVEVIGLVINGLTFAAGLFALWLFYRRNRSFEQQVETGQEQVEVSQKQAETSEKNLFNDRLSRGIEAFSKSELTARNAGLRLIGSLIKDSQAGTEYHALLLNTLHGYIRDRTMLPILDKENDIEQIVGRTDITLGIELLFDLVPPADRGQVKLDHLDFRALLFKFQLDLQNVCLRFTNLEGGVLISANLQGAELRDANLQGAKLGGANLQSADLSDADISEASFLIVENLTQEQLNACVYEKDKPPRELPDGLEVPEGRAYRWEDRDGKMCRRFVHNKEWIDATTPWWYEGDKDENEDT